MMLTYERGVSSPFPFRGKYQHHSRRGRLHLDDRGEMRPPRARPLRRDAASTTAALRLVASKTEIGKEYRKNKVWQKKDKKGI